MHAPKENPVALAIVWIISAFLLLSTVGYMFKSLNNHSSQIIDSGNASPKIVAAHINPDEAIEQHLKPVGEVVIDPNKAPTLAPAPAPTIAATPAPAETPETSTATTTASNEVVTTVCSNCHSTAMATIIGAPEMHSDAWAPRMEKGFDAVLNNAINGLNAMPPRGGSADLTDEQLAEAIRFMSSPPATAPAATPETSTATPETSTATTTASNEVVTTVCSNCHSVTMATIIGAPEMHSDAWAPRMEKGFDAVLNNAINGLNAMPPRGGSADLTDEQLAEAIRFMSSPAK